MDVIRHVSIYGVPQNGWFIFIMETSITMDDLGVPWSTTILGNLYIRNKQVKGASDSPN